MAADTEMTAVADVYAEALLETAQEQGQAHEVGSELADLLEYMAADPEFERFLTADSVDDEPRRASLEKMFRGRMNPLLLNLLQVLNDRKRLRLLRDIGRCYERRIQELRQQLEATVVSAVPLTDDIREQIRALIQRQTGKAAVLREEVRPEAIGGIVIQLGDLRIDGSVASQLELLRKRLLERGGQEIHGAGGQLIEV